MALWAENPACDIRRANTQEQNPTDPHARVPGSSRQVAEAGELGLK